MQTNLIISLEEFPEEGRFLSGELDAAIFGIDSAALRSTGPLSYELEVQLFETELMVRGGITAPFELRCDRCLKNFPYVVELDKSSTQNLWPGDEIIVGARNLYDGKVVR